MAIPEDKVQAVFEVLHGLSHTDFVYLLAELCAIRGWDPTITIGNQDSTGDLVARQTLPTPRSISLVYHDMSQLTSGALQDYLEGYTTDRLTVIVNEAPSDGVRSAASDANVGIIGVGDVASDLVSLSAGDVLESYVSEENAVREEYEELFSTTQPRQRTHAPQQSDSPDQATTESEATTVDRPTYAASSSTPSLSDGAIGTEGRYLNAELLGYEFVETADESGILVAVQLSAHEFDVEIRPQYFTLHSNEGFAYDGVQKRDATLMESLAEELAAPWVTQRSEISAGGRVNYLVFFPVAEAVTPHKLRYKSRYKRLFTMSSDQIEEQTGTGKHHETTLEVLIPPEAVGSLDTLPEGPASALAPLRDPADESTSEVSNTVLSADAVGAEHEHFAVEVEHWDFYHSAGEYVDKEQRDGIFVSLDITPKQNDVSFYNSFLSVLDTEGYVHQGRNSTASEHIAHEGSLNSPWKVTGHGGIDLPESGKIKVLVHIPCSEPLTATELRIEGEDGDTVVEVSKDAWNGLRGLPENLDKAIRNIGYDSDR